MYIDEKKITFLFLLKNLIFFFDLMRFGKMRLICNVQVQVYAQTIKRT